MARTKTVKIGFNFVNWPAPTVEPPFSEHSGEVVDGFISGLDSNSSARAVSLEVSPDSIRLYRRKRASTVDKNFTVLLDLHGMKATEAMLVKALRHRTTRDNLRRIVEATAGHLEFDANFAGQMIASAVFIES